MEEIWLPVVGYEGLYEVSNWGNIRSSYSKCNLALVLDKRYIRLTLCKDKVRKNESAHRMVAMAHIPNPDNKPQVNHINGIRTDNRVVNLEWVTAMENTTHATQMKLRTNFGENNNKAKLTEAAVLDIRENCKKREQTKFAQKYNVNRNTIRRVLNRTLWSHI